MDSKFTAFQKAKELAPFLKGFKVDTSREVGDHYAQLKNGDEVIGIFVETYGKDAGHLEISGDYPRGPDGEYLADSYVNGNRLVCPKIGVNGNRPAAKVAADIERRFLPEYREVLAKVKELKAKREGYKNKVEENVKELRGIYGGSLNRGENGFSLPFENLAGYGDVDYVSNDSCNIKLSSLPIPLAKKILKLLAEADKGAK